MVRRFLFLLAACIASATAQTVTCNPSNCVANPGGTVTLTASQSVTWGLVSGSIGSLSATSGTSTTYTAPNTFDEAKSKFAGCMILPNDSVFNTRVDNLPVNASSASWIAAFGGYAFGFVAFTDVNAIDNTTNTLTNPQFYYTPYYNGKPFQMNNSPTMLREGGAFTSEGGQDHHMISVNHQTCEIYETYQDYDTLQGVGRGINPTGGCNQGQGLTGKCDAQSAAVYSGISDAMVPTNTTTAGNMPIAPTTIRADEIRAGAVNHALRFTTNNGECGSGSLWPSFGSGSCGGSGAIPAGGRLRMKASATCPSSNAASLVICTALKQYGMVWDDTTAGSYPQITIGQTMWSDPVAIAGIPNMYFPPSDFEGVDESSLELSSSSYAVNPANGYVTPSNSAVVSINSGAVYQPIALQPVTVGVQDHYVAMPSGSTWTPPVYVNGTATATYTLSASGGGSVNGTTYTAPTLNPGGRATVTLTACSTADPSACDAIYLTIVPNHCQSSDYTTRVCIDSAATTTYGPDANGDTWAPDTVVLGGIYGSQNYSSFWNGQTDGTLFYSWLDDSGDIDYLFRGFPAGNYKVTIGQGLGTEGYPPCDPYVGWPTTYGPFHATATQNGPGPLYISSQGSIVYYEYDPGLPPTNNGYACYTRSFLSFPAVVAADGKLTIGLGALGNYDVSPNYPMRTTISTLKIEADSTTPYIGVWLNGQNDVVYPNGTVQLSPVWWYISPSTITYSILSGPGTVNSSTGLYTAPSSQSVTAPVIVQLADQNGHTAKQKLWVQGTSSIGAIY